MLKSAIENSSKVIFTSDNVRNETFEQIFNDAKKGNKLETVIVIKDRKEAIIQGDMQSILSITEKSKIGPELALVEGVIPNSIISNVTYSGFIVKYENN